MVKRNQMKKIFLSVLFCMVCGMTAFSQGFQLPEGAKDPGEIQILCIGNSFTYVHDSDMMLREIARSQGLDVRIGKFLAGGYTFGRHLENEESRAAVDFGGYDFAFLQDQSANPARYSRDKDKKVLEDLKTLKKNVLAHSPGCEVILERTWTYSGHEAGGFGTPESLDYHLGRGAAKMARMTTTIAIKIASNLLIFITLYNFYIYFCLYKKPRKSTKNMTTKMTFAKIIFNTGL